MFFLNRSIDESSNDKIYSPSVIMYQLSNLLFCVLLPSSVIIYVVSEVAESIRKM